MYARTIRNPATFLSEVIPRWELYMPHIMTYARELPGCITMLRLCDDVDGTSSTGEIKML